MKLGAVKQPPFENAKRPIASGGKNLLFGYGCESMRSTNYTKYQCNTDASFLLLGKTCRTLQFILACSMYAEISFSPTSSVSGMRYEGVVPSKIRGMPAQQYQGQMPKVQRKTLTVVCPTTPWPGHYNHVS